MKKAVIGILAHVDAGKTTLAEAMLYRTGMMRTLGRVDHGDTALDTHELERARGITIFSSQASLEIGELEATLLDTPGHVDFSSETERTLQVLDYAVLVISGIDGVQAHTRTLWRLLGLYNIPTFVFVTKMDFVRREKDELMAEMQKELSGMCIDFTDDEGFSERLAMCSEDLLDRYLSGEEISDEEAARLIISRRAFPCYFGSGLKLDGVDEFLRGLERFTVGTVYPQSFGARIFKITHDGQNNRLTHMKVTGGVLHVRDTVGQEKINQIRIYSGAKYTTADEIEAGGICAVTGLSDTYIGQGLGYEEAAEEPILEPVMNYRIVLPDDCDPQTMLPKLRQLEEEEPQLHISWDAFLREIHVSLMGAVQTEILKSLILERFGVEVEIDSGRVMYKETIEDTVEGVGHYEPLRHYAEVHLIMEPLERGRGIVIDTKCSEDVLDRNWQRLIIGHLYEKQHLGVLTGSPITDIRITLAAGRAHIKHTEGGDFRQATYRAVRQGLMQAKSKLLEPYYSFRLEVPFDQLGRAINDIRLRKGIIETPEESGGMSVIKGRAPVVLLDGYALEVAAYTGGRGRLLCEPAGYDECHNSEQVIKETCYQPEADMDNPPDSVFCAHGGGFAVKWDKVPEYMHLESCLKKKKAQGAPVVNHRNLNIDEKELEAIMEREFGPIRYHEYRRPIAREEAAQVPVETVPRKQYLIVDGYNVIFAWEDLKTLAANNLEAARDRLMQILCNYSAFTKVNVILVFDAYKVAGTQDRRFDYQNIHVVYTKERELGDNYIEKLVREIGKNEQVRVVTSDRLIQISMIRFGVLRTSAQEFEREIDDVHKKIADVIEDLRLNTPRTSIGDVMKSKNTEDKK